MRKYTKIKTTSCIFFFSVIFLLYGSISEATSGCCSHHSGVCGCDTSVGRQLCCDGTDSPSCGCQYIPPISTYTPPTTVKTSLPVVPDCNTQLNSLLDRATNAENQLKIANTTISDKDSQLKAANSSIKEKDSTIGEQSTFVAWSGIGCIILLITTIYYYKKCKELKK